LKFDDVLAFQYLLFALFTALIIAL